MLSSLVVCLQCLTQAIQQNSKCPLCRNNTLSLKNNCGINKNQKQIKKIKILPLKKDALIELLQENQERHLFFQIIITAF